MAPLQGENYDSYVRSEPELLANGARGVLEWALTSSQFDTIVIEWENINALEKYHNKWLNGKRVNKTHINVSRRLCLFRSSNGKRVINTPSFFVAFAERDYSIEAIFNSVREFLVLLDLLVASGNIPVEQANAERRILQSYLMALPEKEGDEFAKNSRSRARLNALPDGYLSGNAPNVVVVSQHLGIGYRETLQIRH